MKQLTNLKLKTKLVLFFFTGIFHFGFSQGNLPESINMTDDCWFFGSSLKTNRNINHPKGTFYQDLKRGVLIFSIFEDNSMGCIPESYCTGTLMNTVANSASKDYYILTAAHCLIAMSNDVPIYLSFDYEIPSATKRGSDIDFKIAELKLIQPQSYEKVVVDWKSDIALLKFDHNKLSEREKSIFKNAYAFGYTLHSSYDPKNLINISHPEADHKKLFTKPKSIVFRDNYIDHSAIPIRRRGVGVKYGLLEADWDNTGSNPQFGSSGSGLIDIRNSNFGVGGILSAGDEKNTYDLFSYIENAWRIPQSRAKSLQDFLDPKSTWISKIPGGYVHDALPNNPVDYDLDFSKKGEYTTSLQLSIGGFHIINDPDEAIGKIKEGFLGNGLISNHMTDAIYLTITPKDDPEYLFYGIYYGEATSLHAFKGNSWQLGDPDYSDLPGKSNIEYSPIDDISNPSLARRTASDKMKKHIYNYIARKVSEITDFQEVQTLQKLFWDGTYTLDVTVTLRTLDGSPSNSKVRAIKFPHFMPYNAVELFDPFRFRDLWAFKAYPTSRGKNSNNLFIDQVSTGIFSKPISSGNNGGYLNMVNELIPLKNTQASTSNNATNLKFTVNVKKKSPIKKFYYKVWVDWKPDVDNNNAYYFIEDEDDLANPNDPIELIAEGESAKEKFTVTYPMPTVTQLGLDPGAEQYYRVRIATSDRINSDMSPDGVYDNGEVEDYLLHVIAPASSARESTTAVGSPKVDQDALYNPVVLETAPLSDVEAESASKEAIVVVVLPNPASETVNVLFDSQTAAAVTIRLYTLAGVELINEEILASVGNNTNKLDTSKLVKGTYIIKVSGSGVDSSSLLAIERN